MRASLLLALLVTVFQAQSAVSIDFSWFKRFFKAGCYSDTKVFGKILATFGRKCNCDCGKRAELEPVAVLRSGFQQRIVGGWEADRHSHPWLVRIVTPNTDRTHCGGTLLNRRFVLTAAHCVQKRKKENLAVFLGDHDQKDFDDGVEVFAMIKQIIMHHSYSQVTHDNDIALLELNETVQYNDHIKPACIPSCDKDPPAKNAWVVGWGETGERQFDDPVQPDALLEVRVPLISRRRCREEMHYRPERITKNMICAGSEGKDACQGDSGGPLLIEKDNRFEVHGVVSWGMECGSRFKPGVYTNVYKYIKWMKKVMQTDCINCL